MTKISNIMTNQSLAKFGKTAAGAVVATTVLKAVVRPMFIMTDKKSDQKTRTYTAAKEFLYQALCLGIALALLPIFERTGFRMAEKKLKNIPGFEKITKYSEIKEFSQIDKLKKFKKDYLEKSFDTNHVLSDSADKAMHLVNGGLELGSFVGSILGLTIIAPLISHEILHPIMHAIGLEKKHDENNIGKPTEIYLADAKIPTDKTNKVNLSV